MSTSTEEAVHHVLRTDYGNYMLLSDPTTGCRMTKQDRPDRRTARGKIYAAWERKLFNEAYKAFIADDCVRTFSLPQYQGAMTYV